MRKILIIALLFCAPLLFAQQLIEIKTEKPRPLPQSWTNGRYLHFLTLRAEKGDIPSNKELANIYAYGLRGVRKNKQTSLYWLSRAAKMGDRDSMFFMASYTEKQIPATGNYEAPLLWYKKIAAKSFSSADTLAAMAKSKELNAAKKKREELKKEEENAAKKPSVKPQEDTNTPPADGQGFISIEGTAEEPAGKV